MSDKMSPYFSVATTDNCPECNTQWKGPDIFEHFMRAKIDPNHEQHESYKDKTIAEVYDIATNYGYSIEKPKHFRYLIAIELEYNHPDHYDGVSYWQCPGCKEAWNRWTGKKAKIN